MWKGIHSHFIWEKARKLLLMLIILAIWIILAWKISEWIAAAFRGMFL